MENNLILFRLRKEGVDPKDFEVTFREKAPHK